MNAHAAASQDLDLLLGQVATEFFERLSRGEAPQVDEYVQRHPEIAEMIRHALPALQMVSDSIADASSSASSLGARHEKQLGDFHILHELGRGGMGIVYRAFDKQMNRHVAIKTIRDSPEPEMLEMFQKEWRILASLNHPNVVEIFDLAEIQEGGVRKPYFVMPLLNL